MRNTVNLFFFNDMEEIRLKLFFFLLLLFHRLKPKRRQKSKQDKSRYVQVCDVNPSWLLKLSFFP